MNKAPHHEDTEKIFQGIPVSEGVVIAKAVKFDNSSRTIPKYSIKSDEIIRETERLERSLIETRREILEIQEKIGKAIGSQDASIFNAHLLVLEDATILREVNLRIEKEKINAEHLFSEVMNSFIKVFNEMEDTYLKERVCDIRDVTRRVLRNLDGGGKADLSHLQEESIILAFDLPPSETALMHNDFIVGFATDIGSPTSHTAIMARSLGIPAIVGLHDVSARVQNGTEVILDGNKGVLIVSPTKETLERYQSQKYALKDFENKLLALKELPAITLDKHKVELQGNIEMPEDIDSLLSHGATGIGLYRTEFCYMNRTDLPSEEELLEIYSSVVDRMGGREVTIRTIDMGGDKFLSHLKLPEEMNPFLGWRAIRFCLERVEIFKTQLRAILRVATKGKVRLLLPMISNLSEVLKTKHIIEECKKELEEEGLDFATKVSLGVMIEIPSAAIAADIIAPHVDFFSIGTNDLIQYTLAVDRVNEKIAYLYQPFHPAVLRLIKNTIEVGHRHKKEVSLCGEMASDPGGAVILIGMGIDKLSLSSIAVPKIKSVIRGMLVEDAKDIADRAMKCSTAVEVKKLVNPILKRLLPGFSNF